MTTYFPLIVAASLISTAAAAQQRGLDAHVHGSGSLAIAVEGATISMRLEAPGADIVGFEHTASSAEDRALVDAAISDLARPLHLFRFPEAAGCMVQAANVSLTTEFGDDHAGGEHDDEHAHDDDGHADHDDGHEEHAEDGHADHDDGHEEHAEDGHDEPDGAEHNEFHAQYTLACDGPGEIDMLSFAYFDRFENARELDVQIVTDTGASAHEVERDNPVLDLRELF